MCTDLRHKRVAGPQRQAVLLLAILLFALTACWPAATTDTSLSAADAPVLQHRDVRVIADGVEQTLTTSARTVGEAVAAAGLTIGPADEVSPPAWSPISGPPPVTEVTIVRVTESEEISSATIPFQREFVRSAELSPTDQPIIVQRGQDGVQEVVYRITYQDGLERDRWVTEVRTIEPAIDEIVMVGVGADQSEQSVAGTLAYISDGRPVIVRDSTERAFSIETAGALDGRVFQLSPDGAWLLFSRADSDAAFDNSLWIMATNRDAVPVPLNIDNVLWAAWDPSRSDQPRIAYTTARALPNPPGWEANNDVWLLTLDTLPSVDTAPIRLANALPATYGWWGGTYAWSPNGSFLAYAFADAIGLLPVPEEVAEETPLLDDLLSAASVEPQPLRAFTPFDTGAEWAWVPSLAWSDDSNHLVYTEHSLGETDGASRFDVRQSTLGQSEATTVATQAGIWSHAAWSAPNSSASSALYFLRATEPGTGLGSDYALWRAEDSGADAAQVFPEPGQPGSFPAIPQFIAWGPGGEQAAFIFDEALHIIDINTGAVFRQRQDDSLDSHPTWAPYGPNAARP